MNIHWRNLEVQIDQTAPLEFHWWITGELEPIPGSPVRPLRHVLASGTALTRKGALKAVARARKRIARKQDRHRQTFRAIL